MTVESYRQSILIHARQDDVFRYFTEPDAIIAWMGDEAFLDPRPGGQFLLRFEGRYVEGRYLEIDAPPVTFSPHPQQINAARRGYDDWCHALGWVREGLIAGGMLREVEVTAAMPRAQPWVSAR